MAQPLGDWSCFKGQHEVEPVQCPDRAESLGGHLFVSKSPPIGWLREEVGLWHVKVLHAAMHACTIYGSVALLGEGDPQTPEPQRGPGCHVCRRVGPEKAGFQVRQSLSNGAADVPGPRVLACSMLCTSNPFQTKLILLFCICTGAFAPASYG